MLELFMLIAGIILLIRGRMRFTKSKEARGAIVRFTGLVMLAPIPVLIGYSWASGRAPDDAVQIFIEVVALFTTILLMIFAYSNSEINKPVPKANNGSNKIHRCDIDVRRDDDRDRRWG